MSSIIAYKNKQGESFSLEFVIPTAPADEDYWAYIYRVTDSTEAKRDFSVLIRKSLFPDQARARAFATNADPVVEIKRLLDSVMDGSMPLSAPDLSKGWGVF